MDIVILYRKDEHGGIELKMTLRSIQKYLTGYENIWIVGDKPPCQNVKYLPCQDVRERKEFSIANKLLTACKCDEISDPFLRWDDDIFLLKPLDVSEIKNWSDGTLEGVKKIASGGYWLAVHHTIEAGCEKNFDTHTPLIIEKKRFAETVMMADWQPGREFCVKSLYCNGLDGEEMKDLKINMPAYEPHLKKKIEGRLFFSTGPLGLQPEMMNLFEELYPEKSVYEKAEP